MSTRDFKAPPRRRVVLASIDSAKAVNSCVVSTRHQPSPPNLRVLTNKNSLKLNMLLPELRKSVLVPLQSSSRLLKVVRKNSESPVLVDEDFMTKRGRDSEASKDMILGFNAYPSAIMSEMETTSVRGSVIDSSGRYSTSKDTTAPLGGKTSREENIMKLKSYMKELKAISNEIGKEPTKKKAKLCQNLLTLLSKEEGNYQEETKFLRIETRNSIFCSSEDLFKSIDAISPDILKNMTRISLPYFEITQSLVEYITNYKRESEARHKEDQEVIKKVTGELERYLFLPDNDLFGDQQRRFNQLMHELSASIDNAHIEKEKLYTEFAGLKFVVEDIESTLENMGISELSGSIELLVKQKLTMENQVQDLTKDIEKVKAGFKTSIDGFKMTVDKLVTLKGNMKKLEDQFRELGIEHVKQAIREGVAKTESSMKTDTFVTFATEHELDKK